MLFFVILVQWFYSFQQISTDLLCKKWKLEKYSISGKYYPPGENEKKDFFLPLPDGSYRALWEGKEERGNWKPAPDKKTLVLSPETEKTYRLTITHLSTQQLTFFIDDPSDPELSYLLIHLRAAP